VDADQEIAANEEIELARLNPIGPLAVRDRRRDEELVTEDIQAGPLPGGDGGVNSGRGKIEHLRQRLKVRHGVLRQIDPDECRLVGQLTGEIGHRDFAGLGVSAERPCRGVRSRGCGFRRYLALNLDRTGRWTGSGRHDRLGGRLCRCACDGGARFVVARKGRRLLV
jgi:hypothetical protein